MFLFLSAIGIFVLSGLAALPAGRSSRHAGTLGASGAILGGIAGLIPAIHILFTGEAEELRLAWDIPYASFYVQIDALSALFLVPTFFLCALAALYGSRYMSVYAGKKNLGAFWFFFNLLAASMAMVVAARNAVLFLILWEVMALASFFLVSFENEEEKVREAGWIYLVATHLGTAFLLVFFLLLGQKTGGGALDFDKFTGSATQLASTADMCFLLALAGFGAKAGFLPLHVWLPEAHPAAPSHVSAVMSGVMIKTGIYGILRTLTFLGPPASWWGWLLMGIGLVSGISGVLFALAQHDIKRLLAYHSVENIGIITLGLGLGLLGLSLDNPLLSVLGFGGGLLHVVNHALFKGLLFLGAGSVLHATGTRDIDHLGGLIKRMPVTAATFLIGAAAISGLPPLNGFVSEFLIYVGAFSALGTHGATAAAAAVIAGLGLIGGLAAACFTKAFGIIFLGEPRGAHALHAHECGRPMLVPMIVLAGACLSIGLFAPRIAVLLTHPISNVTGIQPGIIENHMTNAASPLSSIVLISVLFLFLLASISLGRKGLLSGKEIAADRGTWDCGYAAPSARMQYTASSFAQPLTEMFQSILRTRRLSEKPEGFFPTYASFKTEATDVFLDGFYRPIFLGIEWIVLKLRWLQQGRVQIYVLYIALTLLSLLVWNLR